MEGGKKGTKEQKRVESAEMGIYFKTCLSGEKLGKIKGPGMMVKIKIG